MVAENVFQHCFSQWKIHVERCSDKVEEYIEADNVKVVKKQNFFIVLIRLFISQTLYGILFSNKSLLKIVFVLPHKADQSCSFLLFLLVIFPLYIKELIQYLEIEFHSTHRVFNSSPVVVFFGRYCMRDLLLLFPIRDFTD